MKDTIKISRFDDQIKDSLEPISIESIQLKKDNSFNNYKTYQSLSINKNQVFFQNKVITLNQFTRLHNYESIYVLLTMKEREILVEKLRVAGKNILVIEQLYPFLKNIKYISNVALNHKVLLSKLKQLKSLGIPLGMFSSFINRKGSEKLFSKINIKNQLDLMFFTLPQHSYQEIFYLNEFRSNREVFCIDFNSMYLSCMQDNFPVPDKISHIPRNEIGSSIDDLSDGLYKVVLENPSSDFIKKYHCLKYVKQIDSLNFIFDNDLKVECFLLKGELVFYNKFFSKIKVIEGFAFNEHMKHPLFNKGIRLYKKRLATDNPTLQSMHKFWIATLHSTSSKTKWLKKDFRTEESLYHFIYEIFAIKKNKGQNIISFISNINKSNKIEVTITNAGFTMKYPDLSSNSCIFAWSSIVIMRARLKMMEFLYNILKIETLDVCYINTDSVHFSISKDKQDDFYKEFNHMISNKVGDIKIEAIGDKAIWLDVGRYWIFKNNELLKFKNTFFNRQGDEKPFLDKIKIFNIFSNPLKFEKKYIHLEQMFTYRNKLSISNDKEHLKLTRFCYSEISSIEDIFIGKIEQEESQKRIKKYLFDTCKTQYEKELK